MFHLKALMILCIYSNFVQINHKTMNKSLIQTAFQKILKEGGDSNYFTLDFAENYYLQVASSKGAIDVFCEAVSNEYLPISRKLNDTQLAKLVELGWKNPSEGNVNFSVELPAKDKKDIDKLVDFVAHTLSEVYGTNEVKKEHFQFFLG